MIILRLIAALSLGLLVHPADSLAQSAKETVELIRRVVDSQGLLGVPDDWYDQGVVTDVGFNTANDLFASEGYLGFFQAAPTGANLTLTSNPSGGSSLECLGNELKIQLAETPQSMEETIALVRESAKVGDFLAVGAPYNIIEVDSGIGAYSLSLSGGRNFDGTWTAEAVVFWAQGYSVSVAIDPKLPGQELCGGPQSEWNSDFSSTEEVRSAVDTIANSIAARLNGEQPENDSLTISEVRVIDANPIYLDGQEFAQLDTFALAGMPGTARNGFLADGASRLAIVVSMAEPATLSLSLDDADGTIEASVGRAGYQAASNTATVEVGEDAHVAAFLVRAPDHLTASGTQRNFAITIAAEAEPPEDADDAPARTGSTTTTLQLHRPPVVLVHGTYSDPTVWTRNGLQDTNMKAALEAAGRKVFLVDYSLSNGFRDRLNSGFGDNKMVVWDDTAHNSAGSSTGIRAALDAMRDPAGSNLSATRVDVVGHSLGGLLPRIYASSSISGPETPEDWRYRRPENFKQGDIRRLVTLCTPHHGSDLSQLLQYFSSQSLDDGKSVSQFLAEKAVVLKIGVIEGLLGQAAIDQIPNRGELEGLPEGSRLPDIGRTEIASHAVSCIARQRNTLEDYDGEYMDTVLSLAELFFWFPGMASDFFEARGQEKDVDTLMNAIVAVGSRSFLYGDESGEIPLEEKNLIGRMLRAAIFGHEPDDGTVRLTSQWGGLKIANRTEIPDILHGHAPEYRHIQDTVVELLNGDGADFAAAFPPAGMVLDNRNRNAPEQTKAQRLAAIDRSNLVPSHAEAISGVAASEQVIIISRPVNEASTALIAEGQATKGMHVKGKSSSWGPHIGLIAVDQAFSKMAGSGNMADFAHFNCEVVSTVSKNIANRRAFETNIEGVTYQARRLAVASSGRFEDFQCDNEQAFADTLAQRLPAGLPTIYMRSGDGTYFEWPTLAPVAPDAANDNNTLPLQVLSDAETDLLLTADYDLLAIGTKREPATLLNDPERGNITQWQIDLVAEINDAVKLTGYTGGDVVHHGPENQFTKSPGVDYPVVAFEPSGRIIALEQGPEGFEDIFVKRYFFQQVRAGWKLWPNRRWNWEANGTSDFRPFSMMLGWPDAQGPIIDIISDDNDDAGDQSPPARPN